MDARCARTHLADQVGAAKYGALFNESGWVEIFWTIAWDGNDNIIVVHTVDSDGRAANPNSTSAHYQRINRRRRAYFSADTALSPRESEVPDHVAALKIEPDLGAGAVRRQCINDNPIIAEAFHLAAGADPV
jgi:hypothetical protein